METIIIEKKGKYDSEFELLKWVMKARSADATRVNISGVFVDNGIIVATDGHRLHMIYSELDIEDGNYTVITSTQKQVILKKNDLQFPEYWRVFPAWKPTQEVFCNGSNNPLIRAIYHDFSDDVSWPIEQIQDLYIPNSTFAMCKEEKRFSPLCLYDNKSRAALIMPLKID